MSDRSPPPSPSSLARPEGEEGRDNGGFSPEHSEEEPEGEDLLDARAVMKDYRAIPELDNYDTGKLDEADYEEISGDARIAAERELRKRERELEESRDDGRGAYRLPTLLEFDDLEQDAGKRRRRIGIEDEEGEEGMVEETGHAMERMEEEREEFVNLDDFDGPLDEFLTLEAPRKEIRRRFREFLSDFRDERGRHVYPARIITMCTDNNQSLEISYLHLSAAVPVLAIWVADNPKQLLELFDQEAMVVVQTLFADYSNMHPEVHVRITHLPIVDRLRDLRQIHLNALIKVRGVVTRRTGVYPQLKMVKFNCGQCSHVMGPYMQDSTGRIKPGSCSNCQGQGPFFLNTEQTIYQNYQKITLQETPGSVPAGRVPRQKEIILLNDLIDTASPGEEVEITGVYRHNFDHGLNFKNGFPVFTTMIEANYVNKKNDFLSSFKLTDEDTKEILRLSKDPNIADMLFRSIAPSIYGHQNVKIGVALAMFGGMAKEFQNKHRIRGDLNMLVLGDPGVAKSQFLKYIEKTAHRAVYTTGKGASAVGLTASVRADPVTREWTLEGGALVLADQSVCLIDEFDKMSDQDRTSIHEAMEQQSISISKAGIVTTLKARCSVIAAANPVAGRYDSSLSFSENVELSDAILSRFDILCVVRDTVDEDTDRRLANFVVNSHVKSHPQFVQTEEEEVAVTPVPQEILKKYVMYARRKCHPKLSNIDDDKIAALYADLRRESMVSGGIPIAVRHIESMIRMSEAHAKMHLRDFVTDDDVNMAIRMMLESFISTQKFSVMRSLRKHFKRYMTFNKDSYELLLYTLKTMTQEALVYRRNTSGRREDVFEAEDPLEIPFEEFRARANELSISSLEGFLNSTQFTENNFRLDNGRKVKMIIKTF